MEILKERAGLIATLSIAAVAVIFGYGNLSSRVEQNTASIVRHESKLDRVDSDISEIKGDLKAILAALKERDRTDRDRADRDRTK